MRCKIPANDLAQRLDSSFCMYKNQPVFVRVDSPILLLYDSWKYGDLVAKIHPDDPEFDISTPPLGYTQVDKMTVSYVTREPFRKYKQGFDKSVMRAVALSDGSGKNHDYFMDIKLTSEYMKNTMSRKYPDIPIAVTKLKVLRKTVDDDPYNYNTSCPGMAISNDCALRIMKDGIIEVIYKQNKVGILRDNEVGNRLQRIRPTVIVPSRRDGWVVSLYLSEFDWVVE